MLHFFGIKTETDVFYQSTRRHIPVSCNLYTIVKTSNITQRNMLFYKLNFLVNLCVKYQFYW
jgi:hypothetical protein